MLTVEEEGIVTVGKVDFVSGDVLVRGLELRFEGDGLGGWVDPVAGVGNDEVVGLSSFGVLELVVVDGAGEVEEGVGVEALSELVALVVEIAFYLELDAEVHVGLFFALESATEFGFESFLAKETEVAESKARVSASKAEADRAMRHLRSLRSKSTNRRKWCQRKWSSQSPIFVEKPKRPFLSGRTCPRAIAEIFPVDNQNDLPFHERTGATRSSGMP